MLDDELKALSELDNLRIRAGELADRGMSSLASIESNAPIDETDAKFWQASGWLLETALLVRVQNKRKSGAAKEGLVKRLQEISLPDHLLSPNDEELPVLLAARTMQALIAFPGLTLSKATLLCYYRIIREIYVADSPDWNAGGARAAAGGEVTAYITSECIRAVLMLARSIHKTAEFFRRTAEFHSRIQRLGVEGIPPEWRDVETERAALEWYISMVNRFSHLAVKLELAKPDPVSGRFNHDGLVKYFSSLGEELRLAFNGAADDFELARSEIQKARDVEEKDPSSGAKKRFNRSQSAHLLAMGVIEEAVAMAERAKGDCGSAEETLANLGKLADLFEEISARVRKVLEPAKRYIASVLDHELTAAASQEKPLWDARELVFACGAYSAIIGWSKDRRREGQHKDERLVRACRLLVEALSEEGMFPRGRPYHSVKEGLRWQTLQFQVCRAFSELLRYAEYPVTPALVKRMLFPFENLKIEVDDARSGRKFIGWHMEDPPIPPRPTMWVSAHAVVALDKLVRVLDKRINQMVLSHFSVKQPEQISLTLDKLIYPDHGRRLLEKPAQDEGQDSQDGTSDEPIGITLQRMRAHIEGIELPGKYSTEFSAVLHGPPGTGKTTLLEALASSSHVPLVEMSPSDIAVSGEEQMEARTRTIFQALSMLTRVVIIFDEFEPVLWKRTHPGPGHQQRDLYTFLTPGMLPKLTRLYSAAKEKRIAYALVTNHLEQLDKAAVRQGRFDHRVGIYMPDPVSRAGRLMLECIAKKQTGNGSGGENGSLKPLEEAEMARFRQVVISGGLISPPVLGSRWMAKNVKKDRGDQKNDNLSPDMAYIFNSTEWKPSYAKLPRPGDKEYEELKTSEAIQLNDWERALKARPKDFDDLMTEPGKPG
jgi:hypothetical protein